MLLQDTQGNHTAILRSSSHIFRRQMPQNCRTLYCTAVARMLRIVQLPISLHDWHTATLATVLQIWRPPYDSPTCECKTIVQASYGCLKFDENPPEVCNFVINLPHGLMPAKITWPNHCTIYVKQIWPITSCLCNKYIMHHLMGWPILFSWKKNEKISKLDTFYISNLTLLFLDAYQRFTQQNCIVT